MSKNYGLIGKKVVVHLYDKNGFPVAGLTGTVSDASDNVDIGHGMRKNLVLVTGLPEKFISSGGESGEGWFSETDSEVAGESVLGTN